MISRDYKGESIIDIPSDYIVLDLETTGLDSCDNEIIEIGALKIINGEEKDSFSTLIKPKNNLDEYITELTGINAEMLETAPNIEEVLPRLINFISNNIIIGHNVNFDINFLYDALIKSNMAPLRNNYIDTLRLSRKLLPNLKHHKLSDLANYYQIDLRGSHRALKDVSITNEIYKKLKETIIQKYNTIDSFINACYSNKRQFVAVDNGPTNGIPFENGDFNEKEKQVYEIIKNILEKNGRSTEDVRCGTGGSNSFDIYLFGLIIRIKLRGKKEYAVISNNYENAYDFSYFQQEECTKNDNGSIRLILNSIDDIKRLEEYIVDRYDEALDGNESYIENISCGLANYVNYLRNSYQ